MTVPAPRDRLKAKPYLRDFHRGIVQSPHWQETADLALLQFIRDQGDPDDTTSQTFNAVRLQGARKLLTIFINMSDDDPVVTRRNPDELPHPNA